MACLLWHQPSHRSLPQAKLPMLPPRAAPIVSASNRRPRRYPIPLNPTQRLSALGVDLLRCCPRLPVQPQPAAAQPVPATARLSRLAP